MIKDCIFTFTSFTPYALLSDLHKLLPNIKLNFIVKKIDFSFNLR